MTEVDRRPPPVEYAVAVDAYLAAAALTPGSRRVYRIALTTWAWPLVSRDAPGYRGAAPVPVLPLATLDEPGAADRIRAGLAARVATGSPRTANRELSILRAAVGWWRAQGWLANDATAGMSGLDIGPSDRPALTRAEFAALLRQRVALREQVFWRLLRDTGAGPARLLALDVTDLDLAVCRGRTRLAGPAVAELRWRAGTGQLLAWLLSGRGAGPVFLTARRAGTDTAPRDRCPVTGRARLSYRRAAELCAAASRSLDPSGRGWTLRQLRPPGRG
jgi:hypothetical protein